MPKEKVEKEYVAAPEYERVARELKKHYPQHLDTINMDRIVFLKEINTSPKRMNALTKKVDPLYKVINSEYDYLIVVFEKTLEDYVPAQKNILIFHELMHCEEFGEKLIDHDVKDFFTLVAGFGVNWRENHEVVDPLTTKVELLLPPVRDEE